MRVLGTFVLGAVTAIALPATSAADERLLDDDTWRYERGCPTIDGALAFGLPSALPTGLAKGVGAGFLIGDVLAWGARVAVLTTSEDSEAWAVTHREVRVRAVGAARHSVGRGTFALRLGAGGVLVAEHRLRHQGMRAGLTGDQLETSAVTFLPQASLDAAIALNIKGAWLFQLSGGPTMTLLDGDARAGWAAEVGVAWQR